MRWILPFALAALLTGCRAPEPAGSAAFPEIERWWLE